MLWTNPHPLRSWPFSKFFCWRLTSSHVNLLLVQSHQAEIIIAKRFFQGRINVTRVGMEPRSCDQGRRKNTPLMARITGQFNYDHPMLFSKAFVFSMAFINIIKQITDNPFHPLRGGRGASSSFSSSVHHKEEPPEVNARAGLHEIQRQVRHYIDVRVFWVKIFSQS